MTRRQYGGLLLATTVAGFLGGLGAHWALNAAPAVVQKTWDLPPVIRAERFEVVDRDGKLRATLGTGSTGAPGLVLSDGLVLIDNNGQPRANLGLAADGAPGLMLYDPGLRYRIALDVAPDGAPALALASKEGRTRAELVVPSEGGPSLILYDTRLQPRVTLDVSTAGVPTLLLTGQNGTVLGRVPDAPAVNHKARNIIHESQR